MKMTMYELLGLVKDGKVPKKFKYDSYIWTYNYESSAYWNKNDIEFEDYMNNRLMKYLDDEVEIIEEEKKIPEKLNYQYRNLYGRLSQHKQSEIDIIDTLNQVIDYLKSKGDE